MSQISNRIYNSFLAAGNTDALSLGGQVYSYKDILEGVRKLHRLFYEGGFRKIAIFGDRTRTAYTSVAYALFSGTTFVPLNPSFPPEQNKNILKSSGVSALIFDLASWEEIKKIVQDIKSPLTLAAINYGNFSESDIKKIHTDIASTPHRFCLAGVADNDTSILKGSPESDWIYILFTSGTSGIPKGVPITYASVGHYIDSLTRMLNLSSSDRTTQLFDLTFDLSMHDIFLTWSVGACLCVPSRSEFIGLKKFIEREHITVWFSVPSAIIIMKSLSQLSPGNYPSIRYSLFCGEALLEDIVDVWRKAAPNSQILNLYGPTEATIAFTKFEVSDFVPPVSYPHGVIPIGKPFGENRACLVNENLEPVAMGDEGELCLAGIQITPGYLNNQAQNTERFFTRTDAAGRSVRWYRTGDRASYDEKLGYIYWGRLDHQVKILGFRVELAEIEHVLRHIADCSQVAVVPWPFKDGYPQGVVAFVVSSKLDKNCILDECKNRLVYYKVPSAIYLLDEMPLNSNGKTDRKILKELLEAQDHDKYKIAYSE